MITFKQYLEEAINDKGLFKAIFVVGIPGAGKSYTISKMHGAISPRVVNTDRATEHYRKKAERAGDDVTRAELKKWSNSRRQVKTLTKVMLSQYIAGMLPLFIDGTATDPDQVLKRAEMLRNFGYDVGMIFLFADPETAHKRTQDRLASNDRPVDKSYSDQAAAAVPAARKKFSGKFEFYREYKTDAEEFDNAAIQQVFKRVQAFYSVPVKNPKGNKYLEELKEAGEKYLAPTIFSQLEIDQAVADWFPPSKNS